MPSVTLKEDGTPALGAAVKVVAKVIGTPDLGVPAGAFTFAIQEGAGASRPCESTGSEPLDSYSISYFCIFKLADLGDYVVTASLAGELKYNLVPNSSITLHAPTVPSITGVNTTLIPLQVFTTISIAGKGFTRDSLVTLNGDACFNVYYISDTVLKVDCLPTVSGSAVLTVSSGGLVATNSDLIMVLGRVLVTLATTGTLTLGSTVHLVATVTGTGSLGVPDGALTFTDQANLGENVCDAQTKSPINSTSIAYSCDLKLSHIANYLIQASVARDSHYDSASSSNLALQVISAPVIAGIAPAKILYQTSRNLDIFGMGYVLGSIVYLNGKPCASSNWISSDHIQGTCFTENVGPASIIVTNPDGGTATNSNLLSIIPIPLVSIGEIIEPALVKNSTAYRAGVLDPLAATVEYQWQITAKPGIRTEDDWQNIFGATSATYTPVASDVQKFLRVAVAGTSNYSGTLYSAPSSQIVAALRLFPPTISSVSSIFLHQGKVTTVTITGSGFTKNSSVQVTAYSFAIGSSNDPVVGGIKINKITYVSSTALEVEVVPRDTSLSFTYIVSDSGLSSSPSQLCMTVL